VLRSEERKCVVRFGGLVIHNIGQLLPVQIHSGCFNTSEYVYPVCVYHCFFTIVLTVLCSIYNCCYFSRKLTLLKTLLKLMQILNMAI